MTTLDLVIIGCVDCIGCIGCVGGVEDCGEKKLCVDAEDDVGENVRAEGATDESSLLLSSRAEFRKKEICIGEEVWLDSAKT